MSRSPEELSRIADEVADEAGALVLAGWRTRPKASKKSRVDLVTEYDLRAEELIRDRLTSRCPEIPIIAEEGGGNVPAGRAWHCDPLDGTTNFVHGHPFWAVSIGVLDGQTPIAGAVVAPALGVRWSGWGAGGAKRNDAPCEVSDTSSLEDSLVATGFPYDRETAPSNNFDSFMRVKRRARGVRRCGSAAIDLCLVADGTYDGYWERALSSWDLAAGAAIVASAGGRITSLTGETPNYSIGHVIASNGRIHEALQRAVDVHS